jgi:hypothetical protein
MQASTHINTAKSRSFCSSLRTSLTNRISWLSLGCSLNSVPTLGVTSNLAYLSREPDERMGVRWVCFLGA